MRPPTHTSSTRVLRLQAAGGLACDERTPLPPPPGPRMTIYFGKSRGKLWRASWLSTLYYDFKTVSHTKRDIPSTRVSFAGRSRLSLSVSFVKTPAVEVKTPINVSLVPLVSVPWQYVSIHPFPISWYLGAFPHVLSLSTLTPCKANTIQFPLAIRVCCTMRDRGLPRSRRRSLSLQVVSRFLIHITAPTDLASVRPRCPTCPGWSARRR